MHTRAARGPSGDPVGLKAAILSDPSIIEKGLRIVDTDLRAGGAGEIDLIGIDRAGALALIAIVADDPGETLLRLLDQYLWIGEQRDLLERAYSKGGMAPRLPVRCLLLAPGFSHAFLQRLSLLTVDVYPYLARRARARDGAWLVEPAAPIFGFGQAEMENGPEMDATAPLVRASEVEAPAPGDLPALGDFPARGDFPASGDLPARQAGPADRPALVAFEDVPPAAEALPALPQLPVESDAGPAATLETLTVEELEEFERFDRQRREGQRGAS